MIGDVYANATIPRPTRGVQLHKKKYALSDIAGLCLKALHDDKHSMSEFAKAFQKDVVGLRALFDFVFEHFKYKEDPVLDMGQVQAVQSPSWLWWKTKTGDCKSFTNFIACTLVNMGVPVILRLVDYGNPTEKHIYPVALLNGKEVPMDVVFKKQQGGAFGTEKRWKSKIKDVIVNPISSYVKKPGLYKVGAASTQSPTPDEIWRGVQALENQFSDIPEDIIEKDGVDVTTMTSGQLDRYLAAQKFKTLAQVESNPSVANMYEKAAQAVQGGSISGIGNVNNEFKKRLIRFIEKTARDDRPAFESFSIAIPKPVNPDAVVEVSGIGKIRIGKFIKKVTKKVTGLFKKLVNWIFKDAGKRAGPFFIYTFIKSNFIKRNKEVSRRLREQERAAKFIAKKGKFSEKKLRTLFSTGIEEQFKMSPQALIDAYTKSPPANTSGIGILPIAAAAASVKAGAIIKAIKSLVAIIQKIVGLFKKKEPLPRIDQTTASELELLRGLEYEDTSDKNKASKASSSRSSAILPIAAAAAAVLIAMN